jgi:hypothetical protein
MTATSVKEPMLMITQTAPPQPAVNTERAARIADQKAEVVAQVIAYEQR